jgi:hypothetical protein
MKQEVRRGRKFVEYHDPETQPEGTFTQEISGADVSYQETDGSWHPADENWATDGVDGFVLKNDKLNHKIRLKGNGGRTWYPRRNVASEYLTFGVPQYRNGNKWSNFRFSGWSVEGKTITLQTRQGVTILVHNRWDGIKIDWVLASSTAPSRMRYPVALTGITYVDGIIYGADGTRLGQLTPTTATDANGAELTCSGAYANGYVEFQADVTGAVFPVVIDPDFAGGTADCTIYGSNADWATARSTSAGYSTAASGKIYLGCRNTFRVNRTALLFDTSSIEDAVTVTQVNLKIYVTDDDSGADFTVLIVKYDWSAYAANLSNATNRETAYDGILAATQETNNLGSTAGGYTGAKTSGNLDTTWVSKTGVTYYGLLSSRDYDNTTPTNSYEQIGFAASENATESYRPVLTVTYTSGSTGTFHPINMTAQFQNLAGGMRG